MKKTIKSCILIAGLASICSCTEQKKAETRFEGTVTYTVSSMDSSANTSAHAWTYTLYFKDDLEKIVFNQPTVILTTVYNTKTKEILLSLEEIGGHKYQTSDVDRLNAMNKAKKNGPPPNIKYVDETKQILGHACKRALIRVPLGIEGNKDSTTITIYYTDSLPAYDKGLFDGTTAYLGLKGFPLEFGMPATATITFTFTAKSVEQKSLADSVFKAPPGYKIANEKEIERVQDSIDQETMKNMPPPPDAK